MYIYITPLRYIERHTAINSTSFRHGIDYEFNAFDNGDAPLALV